MKAKVIHSILSCLAAFALLFMVACNRQESLPEVGGNDIQAVFTLDFGEAAYGKIRSTPTDGEYDPGSGLENFIDLDLSQKDFRCYLFGEDNKLVSTLNAVSILELNERIHQIRFGLDDTEEVKNALATGCRFVFLANWGSYPTPAPGRTDIDALCKDPSAIFDFSQDKTRLSEGNLIPMYGVKEFESGVPGYIAGKTVFDIGTLHLLRAYAKVDVNISFEGFEDETAVTSVSLTHSNGKGYKAPANVTREADYVTGSWKTDYTPVNIPVDATDIGELQLTKDEETGHYVAYVPEYRNVDAENRSRIRIDFTIGDTDNGGIDTVGYVDFKYYENPPEGVEAGQPFDIARNNWYKFNVVAKGKDIVWTVDVIPFTSVELKPDMGLVREESTGYIIGKDSKGDTCWYNAAESPNNPAERTPLYLGPKGQEGEFVTINDTSYLLVYTDFERTARNLDHIFEKDENGALVKHLLTPEGRTGYEKKSGYAEGNPQEQEWYQTESKMRVWLDEGGDPEGSPEARQVYEALKDLQLKGYRILYEWDRWEWGEALSGNEQYRPKYWYDVLGNRYPWSEESDYPYERAKIIGEWVKYLGGTGDYQGDSSDGR